MNVAKYFAALTIIVLVTGFNQPLTHAQTPQLVLTSIFSNEPPPPPDRGSPGDRKGAGTHAAPLVTQPEDSL